MKNLKNLGKALSKAEQKTVNGGRKKWICWSDSTKTSNVFCKFGCSPAPFYGCL